MFSKKWFKMFPTDKTVVSEKVYIVYQLKDKSTGYVYKGSFEIGERGPGAVGLTELTIKTTLRSWISDILVNQGSFCELWVKWNIPENQQLIRFKFNTDLIMVDLCKNLGVPKYELNKGIPEIIEYEIALSNIPKTYTILK